MPDFFRVLSAAVNEIANAAGFVIRDEDPFPLCGGLSEAGVAPLQRLHAKRKGRKNRPHQEKSGNIPPASGPLSGGIQY